MTVRAKTKSEPEPAPIDIHSLALTSLLVMASFYTLYFARSFFLPVVLAILLTLLLNPATRFLKERLRIPGGVSAAVILLGLLVIVTTGLYRLGEPARAWFATVPQILERVEWKLSALSGPIQELTKAAEQMQNLGADAAQPTRTVELRTESLGDRLFNAGPAFLAEAAVVFFLVFFLLASEDLFLQKLVRVLSTREDKRAALEIYRKIEAQIARYLVVLTTINLSVGILVAIAMSLIGMPNPLLWGAMVAVCGYIPYIGPLLGQIALGLVGIMMFDHLGWALLPPAIYFSIDVLVANLIAPLVIGRHLELNPVTIFLAVTFWGWLWGIGGAILAVPMLAAFKIFCDEIEPLAPVGEFLGH